MPVAQIVQFIDARRESALGRPRLLAMLPNAGDVCDVAGRRYRVSRVAVEGEVHQVWLRRWKTNLKPVLICPAPPMPVPKTRIAKVKKPKTPSPCESFAAPTDEQIRDFSLMRDRRLLAHQTCECGEPVSSPWCVAKGANRGLCAACAAPLAPHLAWFLPHLNELPAESLPVDHHIGVKYSAKIISKTCAADWTVSANARSPIELVMFGASPRAFSRLAGVKVAPALSNLIADFYAEAHTKIPPPPPPQTFEPPTEEELAAERRSQRLARLAAVLSPGTTKIPPRDRAEILLAVVTELISEGAQ
jgi:hypothetical protein